MIFVVIPVFNRWKFTEACLISLAKQTYTRFRVVVVSHGSTDETDLRIITNYKWVTLLKGDNSMWWTAAMNLGTRYSLDQGADYILTLNNDLVVKADYLLSLATAAGTYPKSLIGSVSVNIDHPNSVSFAGVRWNRFTAKYSPAVPLHVRYSDMAAGQPVIHSDLLPGRGTLVPASVFRKVGLYDETNFPHYAADEDLSLRAAAAGYSLIVNAASVVYSHISETGIRNQSNYFQFVARSLTSTNSKLRLATRWAWAKKHGSVPFIYFLFDLARISKSIIFRTQNAPGVQEAGSRLIIFQRLFSHYRKSFYDGLMKDCDFLLLHGTDASGIRNESAAYSRQTRQIGIPLTGLKVYFSKYLRDRAANVVVLDFAVQVLNLPFWMWNFRRKKKKVLLWSHGYNRRRGFHPGRSLVDKYRRILINHSDGLLVYSQADKDYLLSKGIVRPVYVLRPTLDSRAISNVKQHYLNNGAEHNNGRQFKYNLTFIGRMNREKNPRGLLRMFDTFAPEYKQQAGVHFIGDGPELVTCKRALADHPFRDHFIFHGEVYDEGAVGKIMMASDLVVILGEVGLSVNHALLYGIPVVTFTRDMNGPYHGPEKEHIIHGKTGFWVLKNDYLQLARVVQHYLENKDLQAEMRRFVCEYANVNLKLEDMIDTFSNVISATAIPKS